MDSAGIYSVDTDGRGEFKVILNRDDFGKRFDPITYLPTMACPADFDVSEDGSKVVFTAYIPKAE
jgi:hypothetical protein